jgi:hypothetical protein
LFINAIELVYIVAHHVIIVRHIGGMGDWHSQSC